MQSNTLNRTWVTWPPHERLDLETVDLFPSQLPQRWLENKHRLKASETTYYDEDRAPLSLSRWSQSNLHHVRSLELQVCFQKKILNQSTSSTPASFSASPAPSRHHAKPNWNRHYNLTNRSDLSINKSTGTCLRGETGSLNLIACAELCPSPPTNLDQKNLIFHFKWSSVPTMSHYSRL